jgi:hypothetical protein
MATNSRGAVARLIGGERFSTCAHLLTSVVAELVHAHTYVHAHGAEAPGVSRRKNVGGELAAYGLLARAGVHGGLRRRLDSKGAAQGCTCATQEAPCSWHGRPTHTTSLLQEHDASTRDARAKQGKEEISSMAHAQSVDQVGCMPSLPFPASQSRSLVFQGAQEHAQLDWAQRWSFGSTERLGNLQKRVHWTKPGQSGGEHWFMRGATAGSVTLGMLHQHRQPKHGGRCEFGCVLLTEGSAEV